MYFSRADFFEDEAIEQVLKYHPWWTDAYSKMTASLGKSQEQENHATLGKKLKQALGSLLSCYYTLSAVALQRGGITLVCSFWKWRLQPAWKMPLYLFVLKILLKYLFTFQSLECFLKFLLLIFSKRRDIDT